MARGRQLVWITPVHFDHAGRPVDPDYGVGEGGHPDQGLPGSPGRPGHGLPPTGRPPTAGQPLPPQRPTPPAGGVGGRPPQRPTPPGAPEVDPTFR
jgi:hypothetical protein